MPVKVVELNLYKIPGIIIQNLGEHLIGVMEGKAQMFDLAFLLHLLQKFHAVQVLYLFIVVAVEAVYQIEVDIIGL